MRAHCFETVAKTLLFILSLAAVSYCQDSKSTQTYPERLIVLPSSSHVWYTSFNGETQLMYKLDVDYPAESALQIISMRLQREGWKPLNWDFMTPSIPSSHLSGWEQFGDDTTKPQTTVHQWLGQWENKRREIVSYAREYRYPAAGTSDLHTLRVLALFIPASVAAKMQREIHAAESKK